ncbi:unnamed protein product [Sphagnum jensenii]|jgi:hypothetical protein
MLLIQLYINPCDHHVGCLQTDYKGHRQALGNKATVPIQHLQAAQTPKMRAHYYYGFCNGLTFLEESNRDVLNFDERVPSREICNSSDVRMNCNIHEAEIDIPLWNSVVKIPLNPLLQNASSKVAGMHHRQQMAAVRTALM